MQGETGPFLGEGEGVGHLGKRRLAESEGCEQPSYVQPSDSTLGLLHSPLDGGGIWGGVAGRWRTSEKELPEGGSRPSGGFSSLFLMDATRFLVVFLGSAKAGHVPRLLCLGLVGEGGGTPEGSRQGGRKCSLPVKSHCVLGLCRYLYFVPSVSGVLEEVGKEFKQCKLTDPWNLV